MLKSYSPLTFIRTQNMTICQRCRNVTVSEPGKHFLLNRTLQPYCSLFCVLKPCNNINLPSNRLSSFKNSFFPDTIRQWNRLQEEIKLIECTRTFKEAVARHLALTAPPLYYSFGHKTDIFHSRLR